MATAQTAHLDALRAYMAPVDVEALPLSGLDEADRRAAIEAPCQIAGVAYDAAFVDLLVAESAAPESLPLLGNLLRRLWDESDRRSPRFTVDAVRRLGGLAGLIAQDAEAEVGHLDPQRMDTVKDAILRLVELDEIGRWVRGDAEWAATPPDALPTFERLVSLRILSRDGGGVRFTHDAVLTAWDRLAGWLRREAPTRRLVLAIRSAAEDWEVKKRPPELTWGAVRLESADSVDPARLGPLAKAFLDASRGELARSSLAAREQLEAERSSLLSVLTGLIAEEIAIEFSTTMDRDQRRAAYSRLQDVRQARIARLTQVEAALGRDSP